MSRTLRGNRAWSLACVCIVAFASRTAVAVDCNNNGVEDAMDIADQTSRDCDANLIPDECDIIDGEPDENGDGVLDICQIPPSGGDGFLKSRYITITPPTGAVRSIQVTIVSMPLNPAREGEVWWAGPEGSITNSPNGTLSGSKLECTSGTPHSQVWTDGFLHLYGSAIVPGATYEVRTCLANGSGCSSPLVVQTGKWGDAVAPFGGGTQPDFGDIGAMVDKFKHLSLAPDIVLADIRGSSGQAVDFVSDFGDIYAAVDAFKDFGYPFTVGACP